jgi:predicted transcriptional regulator
MTSKVLSSALARESLRELASDEVETVWVREIERRVATYARGEVETFAAEDVFAEARCIARTSEERAVVAVTRGAEERFSLTEAHEQELVEALAEIERGEFVTLEELLDSLPGNS